MSNITHSLLRAWISHVFDHPIPYDSKAKAWYLAEDAPEWDGSQDEIPALISATFERAGELLAGFPDAQLDQGFWYLLDCPDLIRSLVNPHIPLPSRLSAVRSTVALFEQVMAPRCSPHLGHLDEGPANALNSVCYMFWDLIWHQLYFDLNRAEIAAEITATLRRQLAIPHDACRESALHGIGHWVKTIPDLTELVDVFLAANPRLRPELVVYAQKARIGQML